MNQQPFITLLLLIQAAFSNHINIPLSYAFSASTPIKYPIQLSFQTSQTFTPQPSDSLRLKDANISLQTEKLRTSDQSIEKVLIGLKYPSQFIRAVSEYYKVPENQIQFGKEESLQLIINDLSFIQSQDIFVNHGFYTLKATYNFGEPVEVQNQQIEIFDSNTIYWNEILILSILTNIKEENQITFKRNQNNHTITIFGNLQNFPQISIIAETQLFKIDTVRMLQNNQLNYISDSLNDIYNNFSQPTRIGFWVLSDFSKFQINQGKIVFKRTSQLFLLYLFLAYYFAICLFILIINRSDNFKTISFIRNIISWVVWKNNEARVQVLRTELQ